MATIVTFGEIMMRLATPNHRRFAQTDQLEMTFGGGEANVAVALAQWGQQARFLTRLPENPLGRACRDRLRATGVCTRHIVFGGDRLGIYFLESGAAQRPSVVVYDRADSALATIQPGQLDLAAAMDAADHLHWTGITPAVSDSAAAATAEVVAAAKAAGMTVSCDLNYRGKLWSKDKARSVMTPLMQHVDWLIANEADADDVFGICADDADITAGKVTAAGYEQVARKLQDRFGFARVAITLRESISASHNRWSAVLLDGESFHQSRSYDILPIVDRVGGGDSFAAGLLYGLLNDMPAEGALNYAVAASCLKHSIPGDWALVSVNEVNRLAGGDASGRVQR